LNPEIRLRFMLGAIVALGVILIAYQGDSSERFFAAVATALGLLSFFFIRPSIPLKERFQRIGKWDVIAPVLLFVFLTVNAPENFFYNIRIYVYVSVFFVGMGTGLSLLFLQKQK
jgi:hypothetical protein